MDTHEIEYRGYRLLLQGEGPGWRVLIVPPGVNMEPILGAVTPDMFSVREVVMRAKKTVDEMLGSGSS
jgi:hypothetical protein